MQFKNTQLFLLLQEEIGRIRATKYDRKEVQLRMTEALVDRNLTQEMATEIGKMFAEYSLGMLDLCQELTLEEAQALHAGGAMTDQEFQQLRRFKEADAIVRFSILAPIIPKIG